MPQYLQGQRALLSLPDSLTVSRARGVSLNCLTEALVIFLAFAMGETTVLSTFLCEFLISQFFKKWQVVTHFSYWV
jgi:hypothetical protein